MGALISAGELNRRITIMQYTNVRGPLAGHDESWAPLATVWAKVRDLSGREIYNAQEMGSEADKEVIIRFRGDITASMQVQLLNYPVANKNLTTRIEWIQLIGLHDYLRLFCKAING